MPDEPRTTSDEGDEEEQGGIERETTSAGKQKPGQERTNEFGTKGRTSKNKNTATRTRDNKFEHLIMN